MCRPPGATQTVPASRRSLSRASRAGRPVVWASRAASRPVKFGGMCWTTTIGRPIVTRLATTLQTAGTPPVDAPMQMIASGLPRPAVRGAGPAGRLAAASRGRLHGAGAVIALGRTHEPVGGVGDEAVDLVGPPVGLLDAIDGAGLQRGERQVGGGVRVAGHDENRDGAHAHQPAQELDAVDAGQLDVEGYHVDRHGGVLENLPSVLSALGRTDEDETLGLLDNGADEPADRAGIVDDEDAIGSAGLRIRRTPRRRPERAGQSCCGNSLLRS